MAYSDYGAEVFKNGQRRTDKEDCPVFSLAEVNHLVNGFYNYFHGVMGDGNIRVGCYKQGLPHIFELQNGEGIEIEYTPPDTDPYEYDDILFKYKGYKFLFNSNKPYVAWMVEPNGTKWKCLYDYGVDTSDSSVGSSCV